MFPASSMRAVTREREREREGSGLKVGQGTKLLLDRCAAEGPGRAAVRSRPEVMSGEDCRALTP